jgi:hypothetical protein
MTTVEVIRVDAYTFPTPSPESDGTLTWDSTTAVTVTAEAAGMSGLGWSYTSPATARLEPLLVDGLPSVSGGALHLTDSPGNGMILRADADRWQVT